jgi:spore coat protein A, manganese oxidase
MADRGGECRMLSRRTFIKAAGGTGLGFALYAYLPGGAKVALAQVPGGTLDPASVPKYRAPLLIPPVMPRAARIPLPGGKPADVWNLGRCRRPRPWCRRDSPGQPVTGCDGV